MERSVILLNVVGSVELFSVLCIVSRKSAREKLFEESFSSIGSPNTDVNFEYQ